MSDRVIAKVRWLLGATGKICYAVPLLACTHLTSGGESELDAVRERIEGIYSLEAWYTSSGVFRPPQVEGRATLKNGTIIFVIHDRMKESSQATIATYGEYRLTAQEFAYRYVSPSTFTMANGSVTVTHTFPWEGMRVFNVIREGENVRLHAKAGPQEFLFTPEGHAYADGGLDNTAAGKRVWTRIGPQ